MQSPGSAERVTASLDWGRARTLDGASVIVPLLYANSLWRVGSSAPARSEIASLRETASLITLYATSVVVVDGQKCADGSAPGHRLDRIAIEYRDVLQFFAGLPADRQELLIQTAIGMEKKIAPNRHDDNYLCRFGLQETADYLRDHGTKGIEERPPRPGEYGRQSVVPSNPTYEQRYLAPDVSAPKQIKARAELHTMLAGLVKKLGAANGH